MTWLQNHANAECKALGNKGRQLWTDNKMKGYNESPRRWDAESRRWAFLVGDHHHHDHTMYPNEVHVRIGEASTTFIKETLRHEFAHAAGFPSESEANRLMNLCA